MRCAYKLHALGSEELGRGPFAGAYDLTVLDGRITSVQNDWLFWENGFDGGMWVPLQRWIMRHHVEDSGLMYQDDDALTGPEYAQFLRVWEQRIADYVAALAPKP